LNCIGLQLTGGFRMQSKPVKTEDVPQFISLSASTGERD
jgi:hypothetical protein